jgi:hypothetical protein
MHGLASILFAASVAITSVQAATVAQYYTDGGCTEFLTSFDPFTNGGCFQFQFTGANSANIVSGTDNGLLSCTWFEGENCSGHSETKTPADECASNFGGGWQSVSCGFEEPCCS